MRFLQKALWLLVLMFVDRNTMKLTKWAVTVSSFRCVELMSSQHFATGLENLPKYSESLGRLNTPHFYYYKEKMFFALPVPLTTSSESSSTAPPWARSCSRRATPPTTRRSRSRCPCAPATRAFSCSTLRACSPLRMARTSSTSARHGGRRRERVHALRPDRVPPAKRALSRYEAQSTTQVKFAKSFDASRAYSTRYASDLRRAHP